MWSFLLRLWNGQHHKMDSVIAATASEKRTIRMLLLVHSLAWLVPHLLLCPLVAGGKAGERFDGNKVRFAFIVTGQRRFVLGQLQRVVGTRNCMRKQVTSGRWPSFDTGRYQYVIDH